MLLPYIHFLTKTQQLELKITPWTHQTKAQISTNAHYLCFLAQANLFFSLVCFSSDFLQQFRHEGLIHTVPYWQFMLRCVCYLNFGEHWILAFPFPKRSSFIIVLHVFCDWTWRNFQSSWTFPNWLTFTSESNELLFFFFSWAICRSFNFWQKGDLRLLSNWLLQIFHRSQLSVLFYKVANNTK